MRDVRRVAVGSCARNAYGVLGSQPYYAQGTYERSVVAMAELPCSGGAHERKSHCFGWLGRDHGRCDR
jgi:hypothetical protein